MTTIKFSVGAFAEAAKAIRNIPGGSRNIEILDHARLDAKKKSLTLTMSDLDIEACASIACDVSAATLSAIPRAVLEFFIARDGNGDDLGTLEFDADLKTVVARNGKGRLTTPVLPGSDFFLMGAGTQDWSFKLRANELIELLRTCEKAMDEKRHFIQGVLLHVTDAELRAAATDGHRVHAVGVDAPELQGAFRDRDADYRGVTIPDRTVKELIRIFDGDESEVTIAGTGAIITVEGEAIRVTSKLIDGTFPDYAKLMQEPGGFRVSVPAKALDSAIGRLLVLPRKDGKGRAETSRPIRMTPVDGGLKLEIKGNDSDAEDLIDCEVEGSGEPIVVNYRYVRDALAAAGGSKVTFAPIEGNAIGVRMLPDNDRSSFLLMQMRY